MIEISKETISASCVCCPASNFEEPKTDIYTLYVHGEHRGTTIHLCPKCMDELGNKILEASIEDDVEKSGILDE